MTALTLVPALREPADPPQLAQARLDLDNPADRGELAERMLPIATALAMAVRDGGREAVTDLLQQVGDGELPALIVVLAALVPVDQTAADLLSWVTWDEYGRPLTGVTPALPRIARGRALKPCGSHAAFNRHRKLGEDPCPACKTAERAYQRNRTPNPKGTRA